MEMLKKRKRSANWTAAEKSLLRDCLKDEINISENKSSDTNTNKAKALAWQKLSQRFNEINDVRRTQDEIKQQWRTMKMDAKKCHSHYKKEMNITGGGARPPSPDLQTNEIVEMLPQEFEEDINIFDSDTVTSKNLNSTQTVTLPSSGSGSNSVEEKQNVNENLAEPIHYNNKELKSRKLDFIEFQSPCRAEKRPRNTSTISESAKFRNNTVTECLKAESDLKIKHMKEAHEWARQEHSLKVIEMQLRILLMEKQLKDT